MSEEDTVTVGQDIIKLELGGAPEGNKDEGAEKPKESEPKKDSPPAEAEKPKDTQASKPAPPPSEKPKEAPAKKESPKPQGAVEAKPALGSREERRVCLAMIRHTTHTDIANMIPSICLGQDEPYASENR